MNFRAPAIVCASRPLAEAAVIARVLTAEHGMVAGYVGGGRGRRLRPVLIPGNIVEAELRARSDNRLPFLRLELVESRGPWLGEPLPAAAIAWVTALAATALPERQPFAGLHQALAAVLEAICVAPSARGWMMPLLSFELLLLRELGYGEPIARPAEGDWPELIQGFDRLGRALARYPLADQPLANRGGGVMAARSMLRDRLVRIGG